MAKNALTNNALTRLPGKIRSERRQRVKSAIRSALRNSRSRADRKIASIGSVLEMKETGPNRYRVKVARLSKRTSGKVELYFDVKVGYPGLLGSLGRAFGASPTVEVVGHEAGKSLFARGVATLAAGESMIAGQQTMIGIGLVR